VVQLAFPTTRLRPNVLLFGAATIVAFLSLFATSSLDLNTLLIAATPLVIAAVAHSLPIAAGGQGLSAGAMVLLSATIVTALPSRGVADVFTACASALLIGAALGAATGYLIGKFRVRSSVVTLSIGAASTALSLDVLNRVSVPTASALNDILFGADFFGIAPIPLVGVAVTCILAQWTLRRLRLDRRSSQEPTFRQIVQSYVFAGLGSATAGIFLGGSLGFMNSSMGVPVLLQILAAVALGGALGSGKAVLGSLFGGTVIVLAEFAAVQWKAPEFLSTSFDAFWLFAAIAVGGGLRQLVTEPNHLVDPKRASWVGYLMDAAVLAVIVVLGWKFAHADIITTIGGVALLAAGQTAVVRLGYVDLSMPALVSFGSTAAISLAAGQDHRLLAIVPCLLVFAIAIGLFHGSITTKLKRAIIPVTVATAGVVQSASTALLFYFPGNYAPSILLALAEHRGAGLVAFALLAPIATCVAVSFSLLALKKRSSRIKSMTAFVFSALCSIIFGILLAGLNGTAHFALVDVYTFPALGAAFLAVNCRKPPGTFIGAAAFFAIAVVVMDTFLVGSGAGYFLRSLALAGAVVGCEISVASGWWKQTWGRRVDR
jgi:ribose transport system permease protein